MGGGQKMDTVKSPFIYPRKDNYYKTKSSLNFDMMRSKVMLNRGGQESSNFVLWVTNIACGALCGVMAFTLIYFEDVMIHWRCNTV